MSTQPSILGSGELWGRGACVEWGAAGAAGAARAAGGGGSLDGCCRQEGRTGPERHHLGSEHSEGGPGEWAEIQGTQQRAVSLSQEQTENNWLKSTL